MKQRIVVIVIAYSMFNVLGICIVYPTLYRQNPVAKTIDTVKRFKQVYGYYIFNAGYRFYTDEIFRVRKIFKRCNSG